MDTVQIDCPKCGRSFEVAADVSTFDCPTCGSKIVFESPSSNASVSIQPSGNKRKSTGILKKVCVVIALIVILAGALFSYDTYIDSVLNSKLEEINDNIDSHNYDRARSLLEGVVYKGPFYWKKGTWHRQYLGKSKEIVTKEVRYYIDIADFSRAYSSLDAFVPPADLSAEWPAIKEALRGEVDEKQAYYLDHLLIELPFSSKDCKKMKSDEVEKSLRVAGFTNIQLIKYDGGSRFPFFSGNDEIEEGDIKEIELLYNGKSITTFNAKDEYPAATRISIVYY